VVEAQHCISTMKLADSVADQNVLESLLDETKPPVPEDCEHLDFLLFTPFRYGPANTHHTRFRPAGDSQGVFYGAASPETAIAEMAFYRLLFFMESPGTPLPTNPAEYTAFAAQISATPSVDLSRPPFDANKEKWEHAQDYAHCHDFVRLARESGIQVIAYRSVRDPKHRLNYAVLSPAAFSQARPVALQTWRIHIREDAVVAKCEAPPIGLSFEVRDFALDSRIVIKDAA
jgi:hypothetical protein